MKEKGGKQMSALQYVFCFLYAVCAIGLLGIVTLQQGSENNALSNLSGGSNESYYAKNMNHSAEAKKKKVTILFEAGFAVLTAASMFVLP